MREDLQGPTERPNPHGLTLSGHPRPHFDSAEAFAGDPDPRRGFLKCDGGLLTESKPGEEGIEALPLLTREGGDVAPKRDVEGQPREVVQGHDVRHASIISVREALPFGA